MHRELKQRLDEFLRICQEPNLSRKDYRELIEKLKVIIAQIDSERAFSTAQIGSVSLPALFVIVSFWHLRFIQASQNFEALAGEHNELSQKFVRAGEIIKKLQQPPHIFVAFEKLEQRKDSEYWIRWRRGSNKSSSVVDVENPELVNGLKKAQRGQLVRLNGIGVAVELLDEFENEGIVYDVVEVIDDQRVKVSSEHSISVVAAISQNLKDLLKIGDKVLLSNNNMVTEKLGEASEVADLILQETPDVKWSSIGGLKKEIAQLREKIELHLLDPEAAKKFHIPEPKGILLVGPPGTGKGLMVKAAVNETARFASERTGKEVKGYYILVNGPADILRKWVGDSPGRIKMIFDQARRRAKEGHLVFIIFDEFESLFTVRTGEQNDAGVRKELVTQFNAEMDGIDSLQGVVVFGLTNRPDILDPAVIRPGRFNLKITVPRPDREGAKDIFSKYLELDLPLHGKYFDSKNYDQEGNYYPTDSRDNRRLKSPGVYESYCLNREPAKIINYFIDKVVNSCYDSKKEENQLLRVTYTDGSSEVFTFEHFMSGALIAAIASLAKEKACNRYSKAGSKEKGQEGLCLRDIYEAVEEIFKGEHKLPTTDDALKQWLYTEGRQAKTPKSVVSLLDGKQSQAVLPKGKSVGPMA